MSRALVVGKLAELAAARWSTGDASEELVRTRAELEDRKARLAGQERGAHRGEAGARRGQPDPVSASRATVEALEQEISELRWKAELQARAGRAAAVR